MSEFQAKPFGEYYLLERVAVGGMAEIFKAKTYGVGGFEKLLAMKRILPHHAQNQEFISMLIDEAKIAVALNHVNIVQVFDLGKIENDYFIAMEFVDGKDLRTLMRRCKQQNIPLTVENAVYIILEICKGLDYAHRKTDKSGKSLGVVHRDISPQNILISFEGEVKIVDFGIAKAANKVTETDAGVLKGKFSYMSPEQAQGFSVGRQTDIFSTGIIMYELLTGQKLFPGESHTDILEKIRKFHIEHPFLPADIPSELEFILANALSPDLKLRYQHASDFQVELTKFLYTSSLDFTARNLAELMRQLFHQELEQERDRDRVDFELDEQTRSFMLRSHSESLVSKTDVGYDEGSEGETADAVVATKNRTIIKKFQNVLRKGKGEGELPKPKIALKTVSKDSLHTNHPAILPLPNPEEKTEPLIQNSSRTPPPALPEVKPVRLPLPNEADSLTTNMNIRISDWATTLNLMPLSRKLAMLFALLSMLFLLITLAVYLGNDREQILIPDNQAAQITPVPVVETPIASPTPEQQDDLRRANFDPKKPHPSAAKLWVDSTPPGARIMTADDLFLGIAPMEITNIPNGVRIVFTFALTHYYSQEKILSFEPLEEKKLQVTLEPQYGSIEVNSTPPGARVLLNKNYVGSTPLRFEKVFPDTPTLLTIQKEGFEEYSISFRVKPEEARVFNKVLEEATRSLIVETTPPGATIFINGVTRGSTPKEFTQLTPGAEYLIVLRAAGYRDFVRKLKIDGDKGFKLSAKLEPMNAKIGTLFVESEPPGATITLNGQAMPQTTPAVFDQLQTTQLYVVKVSLSNYEPMEFRLKVDPEIITSRKAVLKHLTGRITIKSDPPNAAVLLNNRKIGETPISYYSIDAGVDYLLTIRKEGYKEQIKKLNIEAEQNLPLNFSLESQ